MGKFVKNWKANGRPFSGQRLRAKLTKQGVDAIEIDRKVNKRVAKLDKARGAGKALASAFVSGNPLVGSVVRTAAATVGVSKIPGVQKLAGVAREVSTASTVKGSVLSDILPAFNDIKRGDYKAAALSLSVFALTSGFVTWLTIKFDVTLPAWVVPTILELIQTQ